MAQPMSIVINASMQTRSLLKKNNRDIGGVINGLVLIALLFLTMARIVLNQKMRMTTMENKSLEQKTERAWLAPYLVVGDNTFGVGRLNWWLGASDNVSAIPAGDIPQIHFQSTGSAQVRPGLPTISSEHLSPMGARKHIDRIINKLGGSWEAALYLVRWLHWGLGLCPRDAERPREPYEGWADTLYRDFKLGVLQAADSDVLGGIFAERHGAGWNPHSFYPTPHPVCECMVQMTMADGMTKVSSVCDPCVGTGRFLLHASNYSVNLWGMDIDEMMVMVCAINLAIYAPWGVYMTANTRAVLNRNRDEQATIKTMDDARAEHGHKMARPVDVPKKKYDYNKHGQGELFSVEGR
jgi:hypothetical protein